MKTQKEKDVMRWRRETKAAGLRVESARKAEALNLSRQIAAFDRRCSREEYTDTGEAWELLTAAKNLLRRIGK